MNGRGLAGWWPWLAAGLASDWLAWRVTRPSAYCDPGGCAGAAGCHAATGWALLPLLGLAVCSAVLAGWDAAVRRGEARTARRRTRPPLPPGWYWNGDGDARPPPDDDPDWMPDARR